MISLFQLPSTCKFTSTFLYSVEIYVLQILLWLKSYTCLVPPPTFSHIKSLTCVEVSESSSCLFGNISFTLWMIGKFARQTKNSYYGPVSPGRGLNPGIFPPALSFLIYKVRVTLRTQEDAVRISKKCAESIRPAPGHLGALVAGLGLGCLPSSQLVLVVCHRGRGHRRCWRKGSRREALSVARVAGLDPPEQSRVSPTGALRASVDDSEHVPAKAHST